MGKMFPVMVLITVVALLAAVSLQVIELKAFGVF